MTPKAMGPKRTTWALLALMAVTAPGCDSGPSGPGALVGTVTGPSLGGVALQIVGRGIRGFEGLGETQAYAAPLSGTPNAFRVLLVAPQGDELRFEIQVDDVAMEDPVMTVVSAAGVDNLTMLTAGIVTRIER